MLANELQQEVGERGFMLAKKGLAKVSCSNFAPDEILVGKALLEVLYAGREVVLVTKDEDIQEQLYKLIFLLETHYRAMLFGEYLYKVCAKPKQLRNSFRSGLRGCVCLGYRELDPEIRRALR